MPDVYYWPESGDWIILLWFLDINYKKFLIQLLPTSCASNEVYRNAAKLKYNSGVFLEQKKYNLDCLSGGIARVYSRNLGHHSILARKGTFFEKGPPKISPHLFNPFSKRFASK